LQEKDDSRIEYFKITSIFYYLQEEMKCFLIEENFIINRNYIACCPWKEKYLIIYE